jgi:hypothetical protein
MSDQNQTRFFVSSAASTAITLVIVLTTLIALIIGVR